ncbi:MAG: hypothetical protein HKN67_09435 [Saprospiraceae bacterium]|nr:hypothetical protein [Saprospiraceae bacterium]
MRIFALLFFVLISIGLSNCKNETNNQTAGPTLAQTEKAYKADPNPTTGNALIKEVMKALNDASLSEKDRSKLLEQGYETAKSQSITSREAAFLFPIVKGNPDAEDIDKKLLDLGLIMKRLDKSTASNVILKGLMDNHPASVYLEEAKENLNGEPGSIESYMQAVGEKIFENPDNTGINRQSSLQFVDACEAYAVAYPKDSATPEYLFKAAEVAKSIRTFPKSLAIYDWIIEGYPNYEKTPTSLFLKGFIIENNLRDDEKAGKIYNEFLNKYPNHDLADDVQFLIDNLGKTDEEILQMIEAKRKDQ